MAGFKGTPQRSSKQGSRVSSKESEADRVHLTYKNIRTLIDALRTHRVNTLTELCRIERVAASCESEEDSRAFQEPMTTAWQYYVNSNQMLSELRGLTTQYPFCGDIITEARMLVDNDPESNRSWNYAWLVLVKIRDEYVSIFRFVLPSIPRPSGFILEFHLFISSVAQGLGISTGMYCGWWLVIHSLDSGTHVKGGGIRRSQAGGTAVQAPSAYPVCGRIP